MNIYESTQFGNLSPANKSYLDDWVRKKGLTTHSLDIDFPERRDGWRALAATFLAEAVFGAVQDEDPALAEELRNWLSSKTAACFCEVCGIRPEKLQNWLEKGCTIPPDLESCLAPTRLEKTLELQGIQAGLITHEYYEFLTLAEIEDILIEEYEELTDMNHEEEK